MVFYDNCQLSFKLVYLFLDVADIVPVTLVLSFIEFFLVLLFLLATEFAFDFWLFLAPFLIQQLFNRANEIGDWVFVWKNVYQIAISVLLLDVTSWCFKLRESLYFVLRNLVQFATEILYLILHLFEVSDFSALLILLLLWKNRYQFSVFVLESLY